MGGIAPREFNPDVSANGRNRKKPGLQAAIGYARIGPTLGPCAKDRRHAYTDAAHLLGIDVVDDFAAVFAEELLHGRTAGVIDPVPSRVRVICCLYWCFFI